MMRESPVTLRHGFVETLDDETDEAADDVDEDVVTDDVEEADEEVLLALLSAKAIGNAEVSIAAAAKEERTLFIEKKERNGIGESLPRSSDVTLLAKGKILFLLINVRHALFALDMADDFCQERGDREDDETREGTILRNAVGDDDFREGRCSQTFDGRAREESMRCGNRNLGVGTRGKKSFFGGK